MARLLEIQQLGAEVIRAIAEPVANIEAGVMEALVEAMIETCAAAGGAGIAAPQVGESKRLFIMASAPNERYPDAPSMQPAAIFNPEIISLSDTEEGAWEGCLSLPGVRGWVFRATEVRVAYQDAQGKSIDTVFEGFLARLFQHELDHLNGVVFIDRVRSTHDIIMEAEYLRRLEVIPREQS